MNKRLSNMFSVFTIFSLLVSVVSLAAPQSVLADGTYQSLPYSQDWSNIGLITVNDDWSGVSGVIGYRGDGLTSANDVDPQTVLGQESPLVIDVNANQTSPNTFTTGGVTEFHLADPAVALTGSGTADAPYIVFHINTTGFSSINISYNLRDLDGSVDNAVQQVALQYRVGETGNFTNVAAGYVADATTGPSLATLVTPVNVTLPVAVDNQAQLQIRVITTNASGNDEWVGIDDVSITGSPVVVDTAPSVSGTNPASGAANVALNANITVDLSESVNATGSWFDITCTTSGTHTAVPSGGPTSFTLDPSSDFVGGESCTVTVFAAQVTDQDANDPPDNMTGDFTASFSTIEVCGDPATFIHDVQGNGTTSPITGSTVSIEGVVIGDYQGAGQFGGYHVQEEDADADADPATSEGIFIFNTAFPVSAGDKVRVRGTVTEFVSSGQPLTELASVSSVQVCSSGNSVTASSVTLPVSNLSDWERYEGMLINIAQNLTATENFTLGRFGEVALSVNGRLLNPTMVAAPGAPANALQDLNNRSRILLDDGNNLQNIDPTIHPTGGLSTSNTLRSGYTVDGLTGVLEQRFGVYRVQPIGTVTFDPTNPRPAAPDPIPGRLRVAAMNVLNYFTTLDTNPGSGNGPNICGPAASLECRGANTAFEFTRQRDKIITAMVALDADIIGLMEIENNATTAIQDLVNGLNAATAPGTYAFINTGTIGTDAIKVGLLYKPANVTPLGAYAILDSSVDPTFIDTLNRPVLAQTFEENSTGARFTVAVNHLKSKGSNCNSVGDPDTGDGQGNCNLTRRAAAIAEANWLATDPTDSGDPDFLLIGDFNAYLMEDPITALQTAGYTDLIDTFVGADAYSFVFQGQSGYLDHALSNSSLTSQVTGTTEWHVNADEPIVLDYNTDFKSANHVITLYAPDAYRSSDHDPLIVGLDPIATCNGIPATIVGTPGDDVINGTNESDVIVGLSGNDIINGSNGDDVICGDDGNDTLKGGNGNDTLLGGFGNDSLDGANGNDTLSGGAGNDSLIGGGGNDSLDGGANDDALLGNNGDDTLTGGTGPDFFSGGSGSDTNTDFNVGEGDTGTGT